MPQPGSSKWGQAGHAPDSVRLVCAIILVVLSSVKLVRDRLAQDYAWLQWGWLVSDRKESAVITCACLEYAGTYSTGPGWAVLGCDGLCSVLLDCIRGDVFGYVVSLYWFNLGWVWIEIKRVLLGCWVY